MSDINRYVKLAAAIESVKVLADQKAHSGSKAQSAGRWKVADMRFEESRVLREEVVALLEALPTMQHVILHGDDE